MPLAFVFNPLKSLEAMCYLVARLGVVEKVKLMKLVYLAERNHLLQYGRPLSGDVLKALPYGPVASGALDLLNWGSFAGAPVVEHLQLVGYEISLKRRVEHKQLEPSERDVLHRVLQEHGDKPQWMLVKETHEYPEYQVVWAGEGAQVIPYEIILEQYCGPERRLMGAPLVPAGALGHMLSPFDESEPDL
jgi:uncharacterized phage-associated protein